MNKSKVATWVVAGALALGSGMALAETTPEDPALVEPGEETTTTVADETTTTTVAEPTTTTTVAGNDEGDDDGDEGATGEHPDNHGKVVSEAAHDHSHDEEAGNHGKYVSGVARDKADNANKGKGKPESGDDD